MIFAENFESPTTTLKEKPMFKTSNEFSMHIEEIVRDKRLSYMDAVLEYCKENYLEPADVASLINKSLKDKIEMDFRELNYLPKQAKLDV